MRHQERTDMSGINSYDGRERDELSVGRCLDVKVIQRSQLALQFRQHLKYDVIGIVGEILRDLILAECGVKRGVDLRRVNVELRGSAAIDRDRKQWRGGLGIGGNVGQLRQRL